MASSPRRRQAGRPGADERIEHRLAPGAEDPYQMLNQLDRLCRQVPVEPILRLLLDRHHGLGNMPGERLAGVDQAGLVRQPVVDECAFAWLLRAQDRLELRSELRCPPPSIRRIASAFSAPVRSVRRFTKWSIVNALN